VALRWNGSVSLGVSRQLPKATVPHRQINNVICESEPMRLIDPTEAMMLVIIALVTCTTVLTVAAMAIMFGGL